jgi:hypothetical protein
VVQCVLINGYTNLYIKEGAKDIEMGSGLHHCTCIYKGKYRVKFMVFNTTLHNISVISWQSVLLVEETGENHRPATSQ